MKIAISQSKLIESMWETASVYKCPISNTRIHDVYALLWVKNVLNSVSI